MRVNALRIVVFGLVIAIAAIGIAGALGGNGGDTRSQAELRAARAAAQGPAGGDQAGPAERRRGPRGPRGRRGPKGERGPKGDTGPQGPPGAAGTDHAVDLSVNWRGAGAWAGRDTASATIPSIGTVTITCNPSTLKLVLAPADPNVRTVANLTRFESTNSDNFRETSTGGTPIEYAAPARFPTNGMLTGTFSVEPLGGDGGGGPNPATLNLTSYHPNHPSDDYCFIAAQLIYKG
jgi:hypothetical protein